MARSFTETEAHRSSVPLFCGVVGPSGCGKTKSALRLATGIQRVVGGSIFVLDTEADRALHYAPLKGEAAHPPDTFAFKHIRFEAPFGPLDYLAAVEHCVKQGAKTIVIDSVSHMHEGIGGILEMHEAELTRMAGNDYGKRERCKMAAWIRPKQELRRFLNAILQLHMNIIFAVRAKEKMKIEPGKEPKILGFMPISSDELIYEMTLNVLLYPGSGGVPSWQPNEMGEKAIIKLPSQFESIFRERQPLSEDIGQKLAEWAAGGAAKPAAPPPPEPPPDPNVITWSGAIDTAKDADELEKVKGAMKDGYSGKPPEVLVKKWQEKAKTFKGATAPAGGSDASVKS